MGRATGDIFSVVDTNVSHSPCDHTRVVITSEKGQGHSASFVSNVQLASTEETDATQPPAKPGVPPRTEVRFRPIHVNASVTWPSREKERCLRGLGLARTERRRLALGF